MDKLVMSNVLVWVANKWVEDIATEGYVLGKL